MSRPSSTAWTSVAKLSSVRIILAACFDTSLPLPIATPMSAFFRAAASLTASPVMATIWPVVLHRSDEAQLVLGSHAAEDVELSGSALGAARIVGHRLELGAGDDPGSEAEVVGDGLGRDRVVAGDHADVDAGGLGGRDRSLG